MQVTFFEVRSSSDYTKIKSLSDSGKKVACQKIKGNVKLLKAFDSKGDCWRFRKIHRIPNFFIYHKIV